MTREFVYGNAHGESEEVATVRAIYDAFARRDVETALAYLSEDCEFVPAGTSEIINRQEPYVGHDGVREYFADAARVWDELTLYADSIRSADSGVVVFGRAIGRAGDEQVQRRVVWTWRVHDGRAVAMRVSILGDIEPATDPPA
jgi:ketosteroid isomerase-like protein